MPLPCSKGMTTVRLDPSTSLDVLLGRGRPLLLGQWGALLDGALRSRAQLDFPGHSESRVEVHLALSQGKSPGQSYAIKTSQDGARLNLTGSVYGALGRAIGEVLGKTTYAPGEVNLAASEERRQTNFSRLIQYWPLHCKNCYEKRPTEFLLDLLDYRALLGTTELWLYFSQNQYECPFGEHPESYSLEQWTKLKALHSRAKALGLKTGLVSTLNLVYTDQARAHPEWRAAVHPQSGWTLQTVCPSNPEARAQLIANHRQLVEEAGELDTLCLFFYDWGGCGCEKCAPWVETGLKLAEEIAAACREVRPRLEVFITDWHFTPEEIHHFAQIAGKLDWLSGLAATARTEQTSVWARVGYPAGLPRVSFLDTTMTGGWGLLGANPLPGAMAHHVEGARAGGSGGLVLYTEGLYDELNHVLALALAWGRNDLAAALGEWSVWHNVPLTGEQLLAYAREFEASWVNPSEAWYSQRLRVTREAGRAARELTKGLRAQGNWRTALLRQSGELLALYGQFGGINEMERNARALEAAAREAGSYGLGDVESRLANFVDGKERIASQLEAALTNLRRGVLQLPIARWPELDGGSDHLTKIAGFNVKQWRELLASYRARTLKRLEKAADNAKS